MRLSDILLRLCGVRTWKPSPHYAECRRLAEQRLGDLSLRGEQTPHVLKVGAQYPEWGPYQWPEPQPVSPGVNATRDGRWPVPGAPFDEPQQEARRCVAR
jgi:hypothetical protein